LLASAFDALQDPKSRPTQLKKLKEEVKYTPRLNPVPDDVDTLAPGDDLPPVPHYKVTLCCCAVDGSIHLPSPWHGAALCDMTIRSWIAIER
jgi:hypothetical protein